MFNTQAKEYQRCAVNKGFCLLYTLLSSLVQHDEQMAPRLLSLAPKHTFNHTPAKLQVWPLQGVGYKVSHVLGQLGWCTACLMPTPSTNPLLRLAGPSVCTSRRPFPAGMMGIRPPSRHLPATAPHPQTSHQAQELAQGG